ELDVRAESAVVLVVVFLDDDRSVRQLGLKVKPVGCAARVERTYQRGPVGAVRVNRPDAPEDVAANPLRLQRAEHDPPVLQGDRMQRTRNVEMSDLLQVRRLLPFSALGF